MKTKEFIRRVEKIGLSVKEENEVLQISGVDMKTGELVLLSETPTQKSCTTMTKDFSRCLEREQKLQLFAIISEYGSTPVKKR